MAKTYGLRLTALLATGAAVVALMLPTSVEAQISTTRHNLGSAGPAGNNTISGTDEVCVFCHTPHAASSASAPLWNKTLPTTTYTTYSSTTMEAALSNDAGGAIGSVSIACLSCHDGSQAMNSVINAPGSGFGTGSIAGNWTVGNGPTPVLANGVLGVGIGNLTADLSNDHPIGIQYCGGGPTSASPTAACNDGDFKVPTSTAIGNLQVFWVDTGNATNARQKTDMILYTRSFAAGAGPSVECASCHDPHTSANPTFLRISNAQSAVCLACHVK